VYTIITRSILLKRRIGKKITMSVQKVLTEMGKKIVFRAGYTESGNKIIIIVPKNYHNDIRKMGKPVEVSVEEVEE
jgi:hypothetical protein